MRGELERLFLGSAACQLQPCDLVVKEGFLGNVGERRSAPERERLAQRLRGDSRILVARAVDEPCELVGIDAARRGAKPVAPVLSDQSVGTERVAEPRDRTRDFRLYLGTRVRSGECVKDLVDGKDLIAAKKEERQ